ncbi:GATOR complex protein NPRL3 isoform X1 [Talpa occidentalis]|uniref:GATOR complex protein NPRL3 isoform X1 n=1 Tax=Talpa occidentalis TaxID=50954 RepID=UPI0018909A57|nr:GATOR complex protein NPRL3 isoform X1 [Talpa occidentalis]
MGDNTSPISVILVSSGSRGNKLLFRYPFQRGRERRASQTSQARSRYAVNSSGDHADDQDGDARFSDVILATILATKSEMCGQKFELKIDNVRFVGHPTLLQHALGQVSKTDPSPKREAPTMILFNVVFALRANADPSVISCLHTLSRRIATVLQHEERRCQYLTREARLILALQDEASAAADGCGRGSQCWPCHCSLRETALACPVPGALSLAVVPAADEGPPSPFHHILPKCKLARDLKEAYDSLCSSGVVRLHVNSWLEVSFCLPHKIHRAATSLIPPEAIERSLKAIRPYHALLLLSDEKALLAELPLDCSPALVRVVRTASAVKNLQQLAQDADLALLQVFQLAAHLVYWGKAIIVYPLCENNVYMLSPHASVCLHSLLAEQFSSRFPSHDLPSVLSRFSLPVSLSEFRSPLAPPVQEVSRGSLGGQGHGNCCALALQAQAVWAPCAFPGPRQCQPLARLPMDSSRLWSAAVRTQLIQMVVWLLQHRLLVQLHTYVRLMAPPSQAPARPREDDAPFAARGGGRSLSTPNALSFGSPTSSDDMTLTSPSMDNSSAELLPSGDSPLDKRMTESLLASLAEHERAAILSVPAAQNPEDLRMFARLLHYFRGRHHLEEIMYNENTRRSQLLALCDKFRSVLVVAAHEDPVIAVFQALLP